MNCTKSKRNAMSGRNFGDVRQKRKKRRIRGPRERVRNKMPEFGCKCSETSSANCKNLGRDERIGSGR